MASAFVYQDIGACHCSGGGGGGGCDVTICVLGCSTGTPPPVEGASVTVTLTAGGTVSGTTGSGGCVTLNVETAGTYEVVISASGYNTFDANMTMACDNSYTVYLVPTGSADFCCVTFQVNGCCGNPVSGAQVTIDGATLVTDDSGETQAWCQTAVGTYDWEVTAENYVSQSGSYAISQICNQSNCTVPPLITVNLSPATGYGCGPPATPAATPLPSTLSLTDSVYGGTSLSWNAATGVWDGALSATNTFGQCEIAFTIYYEMAQCQCGTAAVTASWCTSYCGACTGAPSDCLPGIPGYGSFTDYCNDFPGPAVPSPEDLDFCEVSCQCLAPVSPYSGAQGACTGCNCYAQPAASHAVTSCVGQPFELEVSMLGTPWPSGATVTITS